MVNRQPKESSTPLISVIIAVYNDWKPLDRCLRSLAEQIGGPTFEVIIVDDGSIEPASQQTLAWNKTYALKSLRESHQGIPNARNSGVRASKGSLLLFVDADCRFHPNCLAALASAIACSPEHDYFQLRLTGECTTLVGRVEHLRLTALQTHLIQPDGRIRYLNTAGFAIRRTRLEAKKLLFDPAALRAEDTLLLASLIQRGELPFFVNDAIVQHAIPLTLIGCLRKDMQSAYLEVHTYEIIESQGVRIRATNRERLRILRFMWKICRQDSIGMLAWFVLFGRQGLRRVASVIFRYLPRRRISGGEKTD